MKKSNLSSRELSPQEISALIEKVASSEPHEIPEWMDVHGYTEANIDHLISIADRWYAIVPNVDLHEESLRGRFHFNLLSVKLLLSVKPSLIIAQRSENANRKRSEKANARIRTCPCDYFEGEEIKALIRKTTRISDIGLFLTEGPIDFKLPEFKPQSLSDSFFKATGIVIKSRTWRAWRDIESMKASNKPQKKMTAQQKRDRRIKYARRFRDLW